MPVSASIAVSHRHAGPRQFAPSAVMPWVRQVLRSGWQHRQDRAMARRVYESGHEDVIEDYRMARRTGADRTGERYRVIG
jgi:hypothetical protein